MPLHAFIKSGSWLVSTTTGLEAVRGCPVYGAPHLRLAAEHVFRHARLPLSACTRPAATVCLRSQELEYIEQVSAVEWRVRPGFVPGMRVPGTFYVNAALRELIFEELQVFAQRAQHGGFLPAVKQVANVAALPGIVQARLCTSAAGVVARCCVTRRASLSAIRNLYITSLVCTMTRCKAWRVASSLSQDGAAVCAGLLMCSAPAPSTASC